MADNSSTGDKPKPMLGLSGTQTIGSAMAAVTAALVGSFLGVAGTLLGAALGSVVATVGGALYSRTLKSAADVAKVRIPGRNRPGTTAGRTDSGATNSGDAVDASASYKAAEATDPKQARTRRKLTPKAWIKIGSVSAGAFAIAMIGITAVEFGTQQPISSLVSSTTGIESTASKQKSTTLGRVLTGEKSSEDNAEKPTGPADESSEQTRQRSDNAGTGNGTRDEEGTSGDEATGDSQDAGQGTGGASETAPTAPAPEIDPTPATDPGPAETPAPEVGSDQGAAEPSNPAGVDGAAGAGQ
ncbi:hypothetical protein ACSYDW_18195 [Paeniglutamicibacter sp. R2-26]|uniref:hypothetical protein n=1 Tax=Paeniglutamicibacter sp. R2-26 TaxID=3144417 RepID=UPI003EE4BAD8